MPYNLVPNPSFETDLSNWSLGSGDFSRSNDRAHDGSWSFKFDGVSANIDSASYPINVIGGATYELIGYGYKVAGFSGAAVIDLMEYDSGDGFLNRTFHVISAFDTWEEVKFLITLNASTAKVKIRFVNDGNATGQSYVDDFTLRIVESAERDYELEGHIFDNDERGFEAEGAAIDQRQFEVVAPEPENSERDYDLVGFVISGDERSYELQGFQGNAERSFEVRGRLDPDVVSRRDYKLRVFDRDESSVWDIPYTRLTLTEELDRGLDGSFSVSYPALKKYAEKFGLTVDEILAAGFRSWRLFRNEDIMYRGVLAHRQITGGATGATSISVNFTDYIGFLAKRRLPKFVFYDQVDSSDIAWAEVERTQNEPNGDLNITRGTNPTTKLRQRTGRFDNLRDFLIGMSREKVEDGFDFDIDNTLALNIYYPTKGFDRPEVVFSDFNIISWSSNKPLASKLTNRVHVLGKGFEDEMVTSTRENTTPQPQWGLLEDTLAEKGVSKISELDDRGDRFLDQNYQPKDTLSIRVRDILPDVLTYHVGDRVRVRLAEIGFDDMLRIVKRTMEISPNGQAIITLTFEEYVDE